MTEIKKEEETCPGSQIEIDTENIDVAAIMDRIKTKIAQQPRKKTVPVFHKMPGSSIPPPRFPDKGEPSGLKSRAKRLLLKLMRPFSPLIKLLILPVYEELRQTILTLDRTNWRLDSLYSIVEKEFRELSAVLNRRIDDVNDAAHRRLDVAFEDIHIIKEYTKLLHNLSHNIVVELTKLKIEEETLKSKARLLEKDFEFLGKREKALEEEIFR